VPFVGKRWVHQVESYDPERGISYWRKNYRTSIEGGDEAALSRDYAYYDPIDTLPPSGQEWWRSRADLGALDELAAARAKASRELAVTQAG
jgi:lysine 2,3-aminomutase